jgi:hypothetical protein
MPSVHTIYSAHEPFVTIIFIHGSRGNYLTNWGPLKDGTNWTSWIGSDLKNADVLSVQHEANFWSISDDGTIDEYAKTIGHGLAQKIRSKRVVFVAYSLGGIIIKRLVKLIADDNKKVSVFKNLECSFCFIATPHLGANFSKLRKLANYFPNKILAIIFGWNPEIQQINDEFLGISRPFVDGIVCFAERMRYCGIIRLIDKSSSFIEDERALNLAISKSHSEICVVTSREDVIYMSILKLARNEKPRIYVGEANFEVDQSIVDRMFSRG